MRLSARPGAAEDHARRAARGLTAAEIDAAVKERTLAGESIYELDTDALHELAPDLIVTQALCSVCAVSYDDVRAIAEEIDSQPMVISLDPHTVGEVLGDARTLAQATDSKDAAVELIREASAGSTACGWPCAAPGAPAGGRARVARPAVRRRSLDAAADRVRRRRGRARASPARTPSSARGRRSRPPSPTS